MAPDAVQYARALRPPYHLLSFLRLLNLLVMHTISIFFFISGLKVTAPRA